MSPVNVVYFVPSNMAASIQDTISSCVQNSQMLSARYCYDEALLVTTFPSHIMSWKEYVSAPYSVEAHSCCHPVVWRWYEVHGGELNGCRAPQAHASHDHIVAPAHGLPEHLLALMVVQRLGDNTRIYLAVAALIHLRP